MKAFGRRAEVVAEYLHKGSRVYLEGRKRTESWDDKQTGIRHYRDLVYADTVVFLDSKGNGDANGHGHRPSADSARDGATITDSDIPL